MKKVVLVAAKRTPIGSFMGSLSQVLATDLGATAIAAALASAHLSPEQVDEVFMGHVLQAGAGQAPARQAALKAGIPNSVPCTTVNKVCSSGMKTIMMGAQAIALGDADIVVAGGMESMSLAPHVLHQRRGIKFGATAFEDTLQKDGLVDAYDQVAMGVFADATAEKHTITREAQDAYAIQSYERSRAAWDNGRMEEEVTPVRVPQRRGDDLVVTEDEEYKNVRLDKIPSLRPAFSKTGTVTAANASTLNDGAAAVILMSEEKAAALQLAPMARIVAYADAAQEPQWFTTATAKALPKALAKAQLSLEDIDLFEFNEAFAVVGLANLALLGLTDENVNINGGAVSLGHPLGCSGTRIVVTLLHAMQQRKAQRGAAAICNGGGGASAIIFESIH